MTWNETLTRLRSATGPGGLPRAPDGGRCLALRVAPSPDGDPLQRQANLRRNEPRRVILVIRPDVAHGHHCPVALDRPTRLPRGLLERRSVLPELEALGQGHVEGLSSRRMLALRHSVSLLLLRGRTPQPYTDGHGHEYHAPSHFLDSSDNPLAWRCSDSSSAKRASKDDKSAGDDRVASYTMWPDRRCTNRVRVLLAARVGRDV